MPTTYKAITTVTLSSSQTNIDFTSIPAIYTDLLLKLSARDDRAGESVTAVYIKINNDESFLTAKRLYGNGSGAFSDSPAGVVGVEPGPNATSNTFGNFEIYFPNYAGSTNKSFSSDAVSETNATLSFCTFAAGLWSQTTAINRITLYPITANFVQHSTATLYGIKNS